MVFGSQPVGKNVLDQKLRKMCHTADIEGNISNHSLRATSATEMGVPEKVIQERTGHRSLEALRTYERTNTNQHLAVSKVLSSSSAVSYSDKVSDQRHQFKATRNVTPFYGTSSGSFSFGDLHGCTVNIYGPPPAPKVSTPSVMTELTEYEMEQFLAD